MKHPIGMKVIEALDRSEKFACCEWVNDEEWKYVIALEECAALIERESGFAELIEALEELTSKMDEVYNHIDRGQSDRVFAYYEFDKARELVAKFKGDE